MRTAFGGSSNCTSKKTIIMKNSTSCDTINEEPEEILVPESEPNAINSLETKTATNDNPDLPHERPSEEKYEIPCLELEDSFSSSLDIPERFYTLDEDKTAERNEINAENFASFDDLSSQKEYEKCDICKYYRVIGDEILHNHAQEPWPKDVRLFQPYEVEQILLPDNANCLAVQTFLKMCNLEYKIDARANAEAMSPTGKVPFIKCGAFIVAELEGIVQFVSSKGISLSQDLTTENKSDMRAYMTLINNVLGNAELYICWNDAETYSEVTKPRYGSIYPWPLNHIQAWSKRSEEIKRLKVLAWHQKSLEEVYNDVETCCQALTDRLDGNDYFFGSKFTELDALLYAHLYLILTVSLPAHLGMIVKKFPKLVQFCARIDTDVMNQISDLNPRVYKKHTKRVVFNETAIVKTLIIPEQSSLLPPLLKEVEEIEIPTKAIHSNSTISINV